MRHHPCTVQASQLGEAVGERGADLGAKTQDTAGTVAQAATDAAVGIKDTTVEHGSKVIVKRDPEARVTRCL